LKKIAFMMAAVLCVLMLTACRQEERAVSAVATAPTLAEALAGIAEATDPGASVDESATNRPPADLPFDTDRRDVPAADASDRQVAYDFLRAMLNAYWSASSFDSTGLLHFSVETDSEQFMMMIDSTLQTIFHSETEIELAATTHINIYDTEGPEEAATVEMRTYFTNGYLFFDDVTDGWQARMAMSIEEVLEMIIPPIDFPIEAIESSWGIEMGEEKTINFWLDGEMMGPMIIDTLASIVGEEDLFGSLGLDGTEHVFREVMHMITLDADFFPVMQHTMLEVEIYYTGVPIALIYVGMWYFIEFNTLTQINFPNHLDAFELVS
jgi:hypothetical protein